MTENVLLFKHSLIFQRTRQSESEFSFIGCYLTQCFYMLTCIFKNVNVIQRKLGFITFKIFLLYCNWFYFPSLYWGTKHAISKCLFWYTDYSNWKQSRPKDSERNLTFHLTTWKNLDKGPVPWRELGPEIATKIMGKVWWGNLGRA